MDFGAGWPNLASLPLVCCRRWCCLLLLLLLFLLLLLLSVCLMAMHQQLVDTAISLPKASTAGSAGSDSTGCLAMAQLVNPLLEAAQKLASQLAKQTDQDLYGQACQMETLLKADPAAHIEEKAASLLIQLEGLKRISYSSGAASSGAASSGTAIPGADSSLKTGVNLQNLFMVRALEGVVENSLLSSGLTSAWTSRLSQAIQEQVPADHEICKMLGKHSWTGRMFRSPPDRTELLKDIQTYRSQVLRRSEMQDCELSAQHLCRDVLILACSRTVTLEDISSFGINGQISYNLKEALGNAYFRLVRHKLGHALGCHFRSKSQKQKRKRRAKDQERKTAEQEERQKQFVNLLATQLELSLSDGAAQEEEAEQSAESDEEESTEQTVLDELTAELQELSAELQTDLDPSGWQVMQSTLVVVLLPLCLPMCC
jgi:hypothetical protein